MCKLQPLGVVLWCHKDTAENQSCKLPAVLAQLSHGASTDSQDRYLSW